MIFYVNHLPADDSHVILSLVLLKLKKYLIKQPVIITRKCTQTPDQPIAQCEIGIRTNTNLSFAAAVLDALIKGMSFMYDIHRPLSHGINSHVLTSKNPCINQAIHVLLMHGFCTFYIHILDRHKE